MSGYESTPIERSAMAPNRTRSMAITHAKTGRSMKKLGIARLSRGRESRAAPDDHLRAQPGVVVGEHERAAMQLGDGFDQAEAEPDTRRAAAGITTEEPLRRPRPVRLRDAWAIVGH